MGDKCYFDSEKSMVLYSDEVYGAHQESRRDHPHNGGISSAGFCRIIAVLSDLFFDVKILCLYQSFCDCLSDKLLSELFSAFLELTLLGDGVAII